MEVERGGGGEDGKGEIGVWRGWVGRWGWGGEGRMDLGGNKGRYGGEVCYSGSRVIRCNSSFRVHFACGRVAT